MGCNWKNQVQEFVDQCDDHGCLKHNCQFLVPFKEELPHPFGNSIYPLLGEGVSPPRYLEGWGLRVVKNL